MHTKIRAISILTMTLTSLFAFGAFQADGLHLFEFIRDAAHTTTARALLNLQFFWSDLPALGVLHDTQFYNGAVFPNSGYGVALLQLPFHFLWNAFSNAPFSPFPDRIIFLFYCLPILFFIYFSILKFINEINFSSTLQKELLATGVALALSVHSIYYLMSMYFCVYESNTAYFLIFEILACLSCLHYQRSPAVRWLVVAGIASGLGLLIRPTGIITLAFWIAILFIIPPHNRDRQSWQDIKNGLRSSSLFFASVAPFIGYWMISNYVRSGHVFSAGFKNVIPLIPELHTLRFGGNPCFTSLKTSIDFFGILINNIFGFWNGHGKFYVNNLPDGLNNCGLIFESADDTLMRAPFIPLGVSIGALAMMVYFTIKKRRWDVLIAGLAIIFILFLYTIRQSGFGARYVSDFWPFLYYISLSTMPFFVIQFMQRKWLWPLIVFLLASSAWTLTTYTSQIVKERGCVASNANDQHVNPSIFHIEKTAYKLNRYRYRTGQQVDYAAALATQNPVSSVRTSEEPGVINLIQDKTGWAADGSVEDISHFFILAPQKIDNNYELIINTSEITPRKIQVYLNGEIKTVDASGPQTRVPFYIEQKKLFSPMLAVAIQWARAFGKQDIQLKSVELR